MLRNLTFAAGFVLALVLMYAAASTAMGRPPSLAFAAIDCTSTATLRIEIEDSGHPELNGGLLALPGAVVHFNRNIQTGALTGVDYYDNGALDDDKARLGVVEERTACLTTTPGDYTAELRFAASLLSCEVVSANAITFGIEVETTLRFVVDDCVAVSATPTPTSTAQPTQTPIVVTATPTATATPTETPAPTQTPVVIFLPVVQTPFPTVAAPAAPTFSAPATGAPTGVITPPNTGDAGLQEVQ